MLRVVIKKEVEKDLKILFPNLRNSESNIKLRADPTGQSFAKSKVFWFQIMLIM